jgi:uncharacterized protein YfaS (alpha-2-macroglobulin family)
VEVEVQMVVKQQQQEGLVEVLVPGAAEVLLTERQETKEVTALLKDMQEVLMLMLALDGVVVEGVELVL